MMNILLSCIFLLFTSVAGFGVGQLPLQQHHSRGTTASSLTTTTLHVLPIDTQTPVEISNVAHSMWIATIDSDIANIQLEEFRKVFAGGIAVMVGGLISTTLLGTIIEKNDLYANLAAESYIDMAEDPAFWKKMTDGMSPEEQVKAKELMKKIKEKREREAGGTPSLSPLSMSSEGAETSSSSSIEAEPTTASSAPLETAKDDTAKASNDMFSDY